MEALLEPCAGDDPGGEDVTHDPLQDRLAGLIKKNAGEGDDVQPPLRAQPGHPGWKKVLDGATELLGRSKDLETVGYLGEALLELHGPAGLASAYDLAARPLRAALGVPPPAGGGRRPGARAGNPRRPAGEPDGQPEDAEPRRPAADPPARRPAADAPAERATGRSNRARYAEIAACRAAADQFVGAARAAFEASFEQYDEAIPRELNVKELTPSAVEIGKALDEQAEALTKAFGARFPGQSLDDGGAPTDGAPDDAGGADVSDAAAAPAAAGGPGGGGGPAGPPRTRAEAVDRLKQAVNYFRDAEPHSPVGPLVERAVRWADLPLTDVLKELVENASAFGRIQKTLGVAPAGDDDEDDDD